MKLKLCAVAAITLAPTLLAACADYAYGPPAGYHGEGWRRHVRRCARNYPNYDPRTDLIERRDGALRCPL